MLTKADFDSISESDLAELVSAQVPEGASLEYKKELYGNSDSDKKELLKDVSALANTNGGHLVIGVEEKDGVANSILSISESNPDSELLRMEQIVRSGIEPPIIGIKMRAVSLTEGGYAIVCRIPKSWIGPHRVVAKNHNRFYLT
jgi:predicted HTH transcriptional regulator